MEPLWWHRTTPRRWALLLAESSPIPPCPSRHRHLKPRGSNFGVSAPDPPMGTQHCGLGVRNTSRRSAADGTLRAAPRPPATPLTPLTPQALRSRCGALQCIQSALSHPIPAQDAASRCALPGVRAHVPHAVPGAQHPQPNLPAAQPHCTATCGPSHGAMGPRCHGAGAHLLLPPALHPAPVVQHGGSRRCGPDTAVPPCPPVCPPPGSLPLAHGVPPVPPPRPSRQEGSGPAPHIPGQPSGCGVPAGPPPALPAAPWGGGKAVGARRRGAAHQRAAVVIPTTPCPGHHRQLSSGPMETGDRSSVTKVTA